MYFPFETCLFATSTGSLIRTSWDDLSGITNDIVNMPGLGRVLNSTFSHCGSLLAASSFELSSANPVVNVILYDMKTMSVVQRIPLHDCAPRPIHNFDFSSDGKTLVFDVSRSNDFMVFEVHDMNIRRRYGEDADALELTAAVAFDPTSQVVASAGFDTHYIKLWTL